MKLNEIKPTLEGDYKLDEGVIPVHVTMLLEQVIRDGKVTNNVQHFVLAGLIEMFKNGGPYRWPRELNTYEMTTSADLIESVKTLAPEQAVQISSWLLGALHRTASYESSPYAATKPMSTVEWVQWVLSRQD